MKKMFAPLGLLLLLGSGVSFTACKDKTKGSNTATPETTTTVDTPTTYTAPVEVSADATLQQGVTDATKDFPGVNATVNNGEITVTGNIKRADWQRLKPSLDALNPKKVNNQLTIN
jgi:osmotically-inducible protein OsmY